MAEDENTKFHRANQKLGEKIPQRRKYLKTMFYFYTTLSSREHSRDVVDEKVGVFKSCM